MLDFNLTPEKIEKYERKSNGFTEDSFNSSEPASFDTLTLSFEDDDGNEPTEYELERQRNIEERNRLFQQLQIGDAKEALKEVTRKPKQLPKKREKHAKESPLPLRPKSLRLQHLTPTGDPLPEKPEVISTAKSAVDRAVSRKPSGPIPMAPTSENTCDEGILKKMLENFNDGCEKEESVKLSLDFELEKFRQELCNLSLTEERVAKVVPFRVYSMAVHPSESKLMLAVGDKWGNLGFWDVLSENASTSIQLLQPHSGPVNCTSFDRYSAVKIYSTSHDGTVRCGDLNKLVFDEVYASDEEMYKNHTTWHCQVDHSTLLIAHGNGEVALVDRRDPNEVQDWYSCHSRSVRTVQLHPLQDHYFITSSAVCEAKIWDRRYINKRSAYAVFVLPHPKGLTSAFFSPAGRYVLTTCNDDRLRIYDVADMRTRPNVMANIRHNTHTGQWLTTFKATWHPRREDVFIVGSMEQPRGILLYGNHGERLHKLMDENLASVCSICLFHPTQNIIFGGNSSGRVHAFM
ncbi:WD repeat-containing protein 76-like isoform X2 [Periplaneta americana]